MLFQSSHEELRYGGRSRPADREEARKAVVRRGNQHHAVGAVGICDPLCRRVVSTYAATSVFLTTAIVNPDVATANLDLALARVVTCRKVDELLLRDEPPLPAGDGQHYFGTYTNIARQCMWKAVAPHSTEPLEARARGRQGVTSKHSKPYAKPLEHARGPAVNMRQVAR